MKNIENHQLKTCIFELRDNFIGIVSELKDCENYNFENFTYAYPGSDNELDKILCTRLAEYYDVKAVTSIHTDDHDLTGVWICYRN